MSKQIKTPLSVMRTLVEIYYDFQHQRIMTNNRIKMNCERNDISEEDMKAFGVTQIQQKIESIEKDIKKIFPEEIKDYPIYENYLSRIYGIGEVLTCGLIAYIDDIRRFDNVSKLWQYAGIGMNRFCKNCEKPTFVERTFEGKTTKAKQLRPLDTCPHCKKELETMKKKLKKTPKKKKFEIQELKEKIADLEDEMKRGTKPIIQKRMSGYMSNWNDKFKVLCWKIGQSFEIQGTKSEYYNLYKKIKEEERKNHPETIKNGTQILYNDGHIRNRALRKIQKIFLAHIWETWRNMEGLPVKKPYVGKHMGHDVIPPIMDKPKKSTKTSTVNGKTKLKSTKKKPKKKKDK